MVVVTAIPAAVAIMILVIPSPMPTIVLVVHIRTVITILAEVRIAGRITINEVVQESLTGSVTVAAEA